MARTHSDMVKDERTVPLQVRVLRSERLSPSFQRVTVGGGEIDRFARRGFDQWFRLFLPTERGDALRLPDRDGLAGYARLLAMPKAVRPSMRNYTVRASRDSAEGREIDIDFVLHESAETGDVEGIAAKWSLECEPGDSVGLLDEGIGFAPRADASWFVLVGDETALPAIAGICASLPADARGVAIIEVPCAADAQELDAPAGLEVRWVARDAAPAGSTRIGSLAYAELVALDLPDTTVHGYAAGESGLATGVRRHLVNERKLAKTSVSFCGYWRLPKGAPAVDAALTTTAAA